MKKQIEFVTKKYTKKFYEPFFCNTKPVGAKNTKIYNGSYIIVPAGTKICIYQNDDPNDHKSNAYIKEVVLKDQISAIFVDRLLDSKKYATIERK